MIYKKEKHKRKKLFSRIPSNFTFWIWTLSKEKEVNEFINKGNEKQHNNMIRVLNYIEKYDKEKFKEINGNNILKRLKINHNKKEKENGVS